MRSQICSGTKLINSQMRFGTKFIKSRNQNHVEQSIPSVSKMMPSDEIKCSYPNPVATNPTVTKPLKEEFVSYEMTDGEYDSDDDDDCAARESKMIPDWARSANLTKALEIQYSKNYPIDPDELFGEVETCNLEAIFGLTYPKFRRRNSSGDWSKDKVTSEEKRKYKLGLAN